MKLPKNLSRKAAYRAASKKTRGKDFRGFSYNKKTGRAVLV